MDLLHHASFAVGLLGIGVILFGVLRGLLGFIRTEVSAVRCGGGEAQRRELRHALGHYLLLGLEFLIAADIIDTLMKPAPKELIALGAIVIIRTVISWSLNTELGPDRAATPSPYPHS